MTTTSATRPVDQFGGPVVLPGDPTYDELRTVWNAIVDKRPRMIVGCTSVDDVVAAVRTARELDLEIGVRCGGHSAIGHAVPDDGLMIDLSPMGGVRVDPVRRRAWVQGGALLGALDRAAQAHGLATTAGNVSHTGVGGLTLGGGMGWLARQYGLSCDNVESFEVVTADGEVVRASAAEHPDLYWGLRGGGGNFGIVTEFEFRLHPVGTQTMLAEFTYPLEQGMQVLGGWRDLNHVAPREATFTASLGSDHSVTVGYVWVGDPTRARQLVPAMRALGRPVAERVLGLSYVALQSMDDTVDGHAWRRYAKGHYLRQFSDDVIEAFLLRGTADGAGGPLPNVGLQAHGGAIDDVADGSSAFSHRATMFEYTAGARWDDAAEDADRIDAARRCAAGLDQYSTGVYVNLVGDEGDAGVRRAYPPAQLARLTAVKDTYDPDNIFHLNHNIRPSGGAHLDAVAG
ncbi:MAG: FAD-binding protein [Propionibacteriales bacterium]|nr:FAD-binding protein [Propionibacteriales bacterium]